MDFKLSKEQSMLIDSIRDLARREKFRDLAAHIEETGEFPFHLLKIYKFFTSCQISNAVN